MNKEIDASIDNPVRLAIVGTGGIGRLHVELAVSNPLITLVGISSLDDDAETLARANGVPHTRRYRDLLAHTPEAVLIATPNQTHLEIGAFFAQSGVHVLVEKPIADTRQAGRELCNVAHAGGVHLLVGHHRRYHHLVRAAQRFVENDIGRLIATNTLVTMQKPDSYYEVEWRRSSAAGPLLVNLIHEVDLLRMICGEIVQVQAASAKLNRTFAFDDSAAMLLHFDNGALGTLVLSESTASPWSWEASVSDGLSYRNAGQDHATFLGTEASLSFPSLTSWRYDEREGEPGWDSSLHSSRLHTTRTNPYLEQLSHFARVVRGHETPLASGEEALRSQVVVDAVILAASTNRTVAVAELLHDT